MTRNRFWLSAAVAAGAVLALQGSAFAGALIDNGTIQLGVNDSGNLNYRPGGVGLVYMPTGNDSTFPGCTCEGWGAGIGETRTGGWVNDAFGGSGITPFSFTSTGSTATSVVNVAGGLRVTHTFAPSAETANLYRVHVDITNTSGANITDLRYTRVMDWDIEPTPFSEYVTHQGTTTTPSVLFASNDGFHTGNPFAPYSSRGATGDFVDVGVDDHGSQFHFGFGALAAGATYSFDIFYGAAASEAAMLAALGAVSVEMFSLGQSSNTGGSTLGVPNTFAFGFRGVGGDVILPNPVPLPAAAWLFAAGLAALGGASRFKRKAA